MLQSTPPSCAKKYAGLCSEPFPLKPTPNEFLHFSLNVGNKPAGGRLISSRDSISYSISTRHFQEHIFYRWFFSLLSFSHLLVRVFLISYFLHLSIPCKVAFEQKNKRSQISSLHLRDGVITGGKTRGSNSLGFWLSWKHVRPAERWALSAVGGKGTWGKLSATYPIGSACMSAIPPRDEGWTGEAKFWTHIWTEEKTAQGCSMEELLA